MPFIKCHVHCSNSENTTLCLLFHHVLPCFLVTKSHLPWYVPIFPSLLTTYYLTFTFPFSASPASGMFLPSVYYVVSLRLLLSLPYCKASSSTTTTNKHQVCLPWKVTYNVLDQKHATQTQDIFYFPNETSDALVVCLFFLFSPYFPIIYSDIIIFLFLIVCLAWLTRPFFESVENDLAAPPISFRQLFLPTLSELYKNLLSFLWHLLLQILPIVLSAV